MEQTTEGINRADVEDAMAYLGIANPKPEIPIDTTVSGHDIVAVARRFRQMEQRLTGLESAVRDIIRAATE